MRNQLIRNQKKKIVIMKKIKLFENFESLDDIDDILLSLQKFITK